VLAVALSVGWTVDGVAVRRKLAMAAFFALACLASGQASGVIALLVGALVSAVATGRTKQLALAGAPVAAVGGLLLSPVLARRLDALDPVTGLPLSWTGPDGRLANLLRYVLPELGKDWSWLFGVRPATRIATPAEPWRDWLWIESGYAWLMWTGGIPLLVAFVVYTSLVWRTARRSLRCGDDLQRALAVPALAGVAVLVLLMVLDQHVVLRGSADLLFPLVGLLVGASSRTPSWAPSRVARRYGAPALRPPRTGPRGATMSP